MVDFLDTRLKKNKQVTCSYENKQISSITETLLNPNYSEFRTAIFDDVCPRSVKNNNTSKHANYILKSLRTAYKGMRFINRKTYHNER